MGTKPSLLFVYPATSTFVTNDIEILGQRYCLIPNSYNWSRKARLPLFLLKQLLALLANMPRVQLVVVEFGGYWALLPALLGKVFNKPVYIILHGTDCASLPSVNYGSLRKPIIRWFCKHAYRLATALLPVSQSLIYSENLYNPADGPQGLKQYFPGLATPTYTVANGLKSDFWLPGPALKQANTFIAVFSEAQFALKGGNLILALAKTKPECTFYIVGTQLPAAIVDAPKNIEFLGRLNPGQLRAYYQRASFHLQLSLFEGFGLSLCEAMLCGCIPITSSVNSLPIIVGPTGYILHSHSIVHLNQLVSTAIAEPQPEKEERARQARQRIINNFPIKSRAQALFKLFNLPT